MEEVLNDISWLSGEACSKACNLALQYLQGTLENSAIQSESESLGVEQSVLSKTLQSLSFVLTSLVGNQPVEVGEEIKAFVSENENELKMAVSANTLHKPMSSQFVNLDWRFEVQVSSRALNEMVQPRFVLKLETEKDTKIFESDYANLKHLYEELSRALKTMDNPRSKKVDKFIKTAKAL